MNSYWCASEWTPPIFNYTFGLSMKCFYHASCLQLDKLCLQKALRMAELKRCVYVNRPDRTSAAATQMTRRDSGICPHNTPHCCPASWDCLSCVSVCVFCSSAVPFPGGYRDYELHSWQILTSWDNKLYVIYLFLSAVHSWNVYEVFCTLCMLHENSRCCWRRCGTRIQLYGP